MRKAKIGIVGMCSAVESGAQRYEELMSGAQHALEAAGIEVAVASKACYTPADALTIVEEMKTAEIDALAMIYVTWVMDSQSYLFTNELNVPTVCWAVPYTETFSIGCVQDYVSVLTAEGIPFTYVYGLPEEPSVIDRVKQTAIAGRIVKEIAALRLALLGPRQTWRVAGPQDMSMEEWDFSRALGSTIVHMEMEEIIDQAKTYSDTEAEEALTALRNRTGKTLCSHDTMVWLAKVYLAMKETIRTTDIKVFAAECYPNYGGLMNQPASWLEDEGYVVDTEGDIAHAVVKYILNMAACGGAAALGETGSFDDEANCLNIAHEGSTPASLAVSVEEVQASPENENGSFIGFPLKPMECCTVCDLQGVNGTYKLFLAEGEVLPVTHEEWVNGGEKLLIKLRINGAKPSEVIDTMIRHGFHHHLVVKEGSWAEQMELICKFLGIEVVRAGKRTC